MRRLAVLIASVLSVGFFAGCDAIQYPPESTVYRPAYEAVKAAKDLPAGAVVDPKRNAKLYIAKDAGQAVIEYECTDATGRTVTDSYIVYLKRVNRRWVAERVLQQPKFAPVEAPAATTHTP
jgi:hypothetical protein